MGRCAANARTSISAVGKLAGLLPRAPFPAAAEARPSPLRRAGLGLVSKPSLQGSNQSHVVRAFSRHLSLRHLGGVWGSFLLPLRRFWVPCQQVCTENLPGNAVPCSPQAVSWAPPLWSAIRMAPRVGSAHLHRLLLSPDWTWGGVGTMAGLKFSSSLSHCKTIHLLR